MATRQEIWSRFVTIFNFDQFLHVSPVLAAATMSPGSWHYWWALQFQLPSLAFAIEESGSGDCPCSNQWLTRHRMLNGAICSLGYQSLSWWEKHAETAAFRLLWGECDATDRLASMELLPSKTLGGPSGFRTRELPSEHIFPWVLKRSIWVCCMRCLLTSMWYSYAM